MSAPPRSSAALLAAALAGATLVLGFVDPAEARWLPVCVFHELTGLYCPGCGTTRALHQLALGNFAAAWRSNALVASLLPLLALAALCGTDLSQRPARIHATLAVAIVFGLARNLPTWPFTLLAP